MCSYGGALQDALRAAVFAPFERLSGITVIEAEQPDVTRVAAMVDRGDVEWDAVNLNLLDVLSLARKGDYWEEIDYTIFDTANIAERHRHRHAVDGLVFAQVLAYRTDVFPDPPRGWQDFWDTSTFPGPRTMPAGSGGLRPFLEAALIADDVPAADLYPLDIDRAFRSLSSIRGSIVTWWEEGEAPAEMLANQEVVMASAWSGRIAAVQEAGAPVAIAWTDGMLGTDVWGIPKGATNAENAQKFAAFLTMPEPQAHLAMRIPYGFVNARAAELIPPERLRELPTSPALEGTVFANDAQWWAENLDTVRARWDDWINES